MSEAGGSSDLPGSRLRRQVLATSGPEIEMTRYGLLIAIGFACLLAACQSSTSGYAGRQCEADGQVKDTQAFRKCVDAIYARDRAIANRRKGGGR